MATETRSFVELFFDYLDAANWLEAYVYDYDTFPRTEWMIKQAEVKMTEGGGWRAGIVFEHKQLELFGATEDA